MLMRNWAEGNPYLELVKIQTCAVTMEVSMEVSMEILQNNKNRTA